MSSEPTFSMGPERSEGSRNWSNSQIAVNHMITEPITRGAKRDEMECGIRRGGRRSLRRLMERKSGVEDVLLEGDSWDGHLGLRDLTGFEVGE